MTPPTRRISLSVCVLIGVLIAAALAGTSLLIRTALAAPAPTAYVSQTCLVGDHDRNGRFTPRQHMLLQQATSIPMPTSAPLVQSATTRVSVASDGTEANNESATPALSGDGRIVAFWSDADNLVSGDTNNHSDIFVHDQVTGETTRVSVASDGTEANNRSEAPAVSADGRIVAFWSYADNLVGGDTNDWTDIFVHDRVTGETTRVSVASDGTEANRFSHTPALSADGRIVAFWSRASNLVSGDTNDWWDIFVHDRVTGATTRVSVASDGTEANNGSDTPTLSADGRYVAFSSDANNLVSGDTNRWRDIFVHDRVTGETTRVSVASDGTEGNNGSWAPFLSGDGRYVTFSSSSDNLVSGDSKDETDIFVHDRVTGETTLVLAASDGIEGNKAASASVLSGDGRYVAFQSISDNRVSEDGVDVVDIFVHDRETGETTLVSVASDGTQADCLSSKPALSADGRYVAFLSYATNLVSGDTNRVRDIFVHDRTVPLPMPTPTTTPTTTLSTTPTPTAEDDALIVNVPMGAPGSVFIFTAPGLPVGAQAQVATREPDAATFTDLLTLTVPDDGTLAFFFVTPADAAVGTYTLRITTETGLAQAVVREQTITLDVDAPQHAEAPADPDTPRVLLNPAQIENPATIIYLPIIRRP